MDEMQKTFEIWNLSQNDEEVLSGPYDSQHVNSMFNAWKAAISNKQSDESIMSTPLGQKMLYGSTLNKSTGEYEANKPTQNLDVCAYYVCATCGKKMQSLDESCRCIIPSKTRDTPD